MKDADALQEQHIERLVENVTAIAEIVCNKCDREESISGMGDYDAAEYFYKEGWFATENKCYCPDCNSTRLKNISKKKRK